MDLHCYMILIHMGTIAMLFFSKLRIYIYLREIELKHLSLQPVHKQKYVDR